MNSSNNLKIIAIDPSVNNVGIAYCDFDNIQKETLAWASFLWNPIGDTLVKKANWIARRIKLEFVHGVDIVVLEYPQFFSSEKGAVSATQGYTLDLAYICGMIAGAFINKAQVILYTPNEWKGNQTKEAIEYKYKKRFGSWKGMQNKSEHEMEASMMLIKHLEKCLMTKT